jgi:hypothetical protein
LSGSASLRGKGDIGGRVFGFGGFVVWVALDEFKESFDVDGFAEDHGAGDEVFDGVDVGFGGEEEDAEVGVFFGEFAAEVVAVAAGEADIHEGEVEVVFGEMLGGGFCGGVREDLIAVGLEDVNHGLARGGVVFEIEDALRGHDVFSGTVDTVGGQTGGGKGTECESSHGLTIGAQRSDVALAA